MRPGLPQTRLQPRNRSQLTRTTNEQRRTTHAFLQLQLPLIHHILQLELVPDLDRSGVGHELDLFLLERDWRSAWKCEEDGHAILVALHRFRVDGRAVLGVESC